MKGYPAEIGYPIYLKGNDQAVFKFDFAFDVDTKLHTCFIAQLNDDSVQITFLFLGLR